eukprot:483027-Rhodomonas_salina.1
MYERNTLEVRNKTLVSPATAFNSVPPFHQVRPPFCAHVSGHVRYADPRMVLRLRYAESGTAKGRCYAESGTMLGVEYEQESAVLR